MADNSDDIIEQGTAGIDDPLLRERRKNALRQKDEQRRMQLDVTAIDAAETELELKGADRSKLRQIALDYTQSIDSPRTLAAIRMLASQGETDQIHELLQTVQSRGGNTQKAREAIASGIESSDIGESAAHLTGGGAQSIRDGTVFAGGGDVVGNLYNQAAAAGKYSPETLSKQSTASLRGLYDNQASLSHTPPRGQPGASSPYNRVLSNMRSLQTNGKLQLNMSGGALREMRRW